MLQFLMKPGWACIPKPLKKLNIKVEKFRQHTAVSCPLNVPIGHITLQKKHSAHLPGAGHHAKLSLHYLSCSQKYPFEAGGTLFPFYKWENSGKCVQGHAAGKHRK